MQNSSNIARKAAYLFLTLCSLSLLIFGGYKLYLFLSPQKIELLEIPFGIHEKTVIVKGDTPDFLAEFSKYPIQTQSEFRRAREFLRNGSYEKAYEIYNGISLLYPDLYYSLWYESIALFEMSSLRDAEKNRLNLITDKLELKYKETGLTKYLKSRKSYLGDNKTVALELAKKAVEQSPTFAEIRFWYGKLLKENNHLDEALTEIRYAISLSQGNLSEAYDLMAWIFHQQGKLDSLSSLIEYGLSQYPLDSELLLLKGYLLEYEGHYEEAEKNYQRILAFRPEYDLASIALATLGEKMPPINNYVKVLPSEKTTLAREILEPLVEKYPENLPLREALGLAYLKGRDFDRARVQFREIQSRDSEYPNIQDLIQECNAPKLIYNQDRNILEADLNRAVDSLRESEPTSVHDFSTMLGHYLVRYGATPKDFFKKYDIKNFKPIKKNVWQESFYDAPYKHTYTVIFDSLNHFSEVHVVVYDSSTISNHLGLAPEIFTRFLKQNSRISGIGNNTGETDCGDNLIIDASVWDTQDNFEILARVVGSPREIRMVRFDKSKLPTGIKLCDYYKYLIEY